MASRKDTELEAFREVFEPVAVAESDGAAAGAGPSVDPDSPVMVSAPSPASHGGRRLALPDDPSLGRTFRLASLGLSVAGILAQALFLRALVASASVTFAACTLLAAAALGAAGLFLWVHATRIDPVPEPAGIRDWALADAGYVLACLAFAPLAVVCALVHIPRAATRRAVAAAAAVAVIAVGAGALGYRPLTSGMVTAARTQAGYLSENGAVYISDASSAYHFNPACAVLSAHPEAPACTVSIDDALATGKVRACDRCAVHDGDALVESRAQDAEAVELARQNEEASGADLERVHEMVPDSL